LEVVDGPGAIRVVNLGATPVILGGDARRCTVLVPGAPVKALKFWEEKGQVYCLDILAEKTYPVSPGYRHPLKKVEVVVCSNDKGAKSSASAPVPRKPASPASSAIAPVKKPKPGLPSVSIAKPPSSPKASQQATPPPPLPTKSGPQPSLKQKPSAPVTGACPVCDTLVKGVAGNRRCTNCWTMF
jgi:hypothetical protein